MIVSCVAELRHFDAVPASTLLNTKLTSSKLAKDNIRAKEICLLISVYFKSV
jgi:hypothetical protein